MNQKIPFHELSARIALATGIGAESAELFVKNFFDLLSEALTSGESVRIKGLGAFNVIEVDGDRNIEFLPDKEITDVINAPFAMFEAVSLNNDLSDEMLGEVDNQANTVTNIEADTQPTIEPKQSETQEVEIRPDELAATAAVIAETTVPAHPEETTPTEIAAEPEIKVESEATAMPVPASETAPTVEAETPTETETPSEPASTAQSEKPAEPEKAIEPENPISETAPEQDHNELPAKEDMSEEQPHTTVELQPEAMPPHSETVSEHAEAASVYKAETAPEETISQPSEVVTEPVTAPAPIPPTAIKEEPAEPKQETPAVISPQTVVERAQASVPPVTKAEPAEPDAPVAPATPVVPVTRPRPVAELEEDEEEYVTPPPTKSSGGGNFWIGLIVGLIVGLALGACGIYLAIDKFFPTMHQSSVFNQEDSAEADALFDAIMSDSVPETAEAISEDTIAAPVEEPVAVQPEAQTEEPQADVAAPAAASSATATVTDTVRRGYLIHDMAKKHFGSKDFWVYIYEENKSKIGNPNNMQPGVVLVIPPAEKYGISVNDPESLRKARAKAGEVLRKFSR